MLAGSGRPTTPLMGWAVEPKFDGWRAIVERTGGRTVVTTRNGHDVTDKVPTLRALIGPDIVLDGELVAGAGTLDDFYRLFGALASRAANAVTFIAFDVLAIADELLVQQAYDARRAVLTSLDLPGVLVAPSYDGADLDGVLTACDDAGMEGVVLKRRRSIYRPGQRSSDWRKVKCAAWAAHLERRIAR